MRPIVADGRTTVGATVEVLGTLVGLPVGAGPGEGVNTTPHPEIPTRNPRKVRPTANRKKRRMVGV